MSPAPQDPPLAGPFVFETAEVDGRTVSLPYRLGDGPRFVERVELPVALVESPESMAAVRVLHLVAGVSYYKCVAPVPLVVPVLSGAERDLVLRIYDDGLREFAHRNGFDVPLPVDLVTDDRIEAVRWVSVPAGSGSGVGAEAPEPLRGEALIPVGGGKDSALVASLVPDGQLFSVNPVGAQEHLAAFMDRPLLAARRHLDPQLRDLIASGVPNGHVPVTAITSAISVAVAVACGFHDVVMGIERSADEPTVVTADGVPVNHQFSKSSEAEALLAGAFEPTGVRYFSLLRPMTELAIGAAVADRGLAADIVSCNRVFTVWNESTASREQRPCGSCAKCLFTALMVAPASSPDALEEQYGTAVFDRADHIDDVRDLWSTEKPFDCVGERLESASALVLLSELPEWKDQEVVRALAPEAVAEVAAGGVVPAELLALGPLDDLPADYRGVMEELRADLTRLAGSVRAAG